MIEYFPSIGDWLISLLPYPIQLVWAAGALVATAGFVVWLLIEGIPNIIKELFSRPRW